MNMTLPHDHAWWPNEPPNQPKMRPLGQPHPRPAKPTQNDTFWTNAPRGQSNQHKMTPFCTPFPATPKTNPKWAQHSARHTKHRQGAVLCRHLTRSPKYQRMTPFCRAPHPIHTTPQKTHFGQTSNAAPRTCQWHFGSTNTGPTFPLRVVHPGRPNLTRARRPDPPPKLTNVIFFKYRFRLNLVGI